MRNIKDIKRADADSLRCKGNFRHHFIDYDVITVQRRGVSKYELYEECSDCGRKRVTVLPVSLVKRTRNGKRNWSYRYVETQNDEYKRQTGSFTPEEAKRELIRRALSK